MPARKLKAILTSSGASFCVQARIKNSGEIVAVKQILEDEHMMNRETEILQLVRNQPTLINLRDHFYTS